MGFQRDCVPLVRSRVTPHRVGRCRNATEGTDPIRDALQERASLK